MAPTESTRRRLLARGALAVGGVVAGGAAVKTIGDARERRPVVRSEPAHQGREVVPFHGVHQAGIETPAQSHAVFLGFDLLPSTDRAALKRMMRLLTDDAVRLTEGRAPLGDTEPELAVLPARLTVTFGFGPGLFAAAGVKPPIAPLPPFPIDRLEDRWSHGEFAIQVCADDPLTVAHAQRMLVKDTLAFGRPRWAQRGFRRSRGVEDDGVTQRNVMGQLDGTRNPAPGSDVFAGAVWRDDGGTTLVIRRIRAEMTKWDMVDAASKELAVGRTLATGAPLSGGGEHDLPDYTKRNSIGLPVIPEFSHIARAHVTDDRQRIFRRPYNFDEAPAADGTPDTGLVFAAYQRDIAEQFIPIQRNLAEVDLLNDWVTPIGSAVFAIPPGCGPDGWIGQTLLG